MGIGGMVSLSAVGIFSPNEQ